MQEVSEMRVRSLGQEDPLEEGNPLQYSGLENLMDRGAWRAMVHRVMEETRLWRLSTHAQHHYYISINVRLGSFAKDVFG